MLIDGDHSTEGVESDINNILTYTPNIHMVVLMHDSYNPYCRQGMRQAKWQNCPYVHDVELDFINGVLSHYKDTNMQMWGGFGFANLKPEKRDHPLIIQESAAVNYNKTLSFSNHNYLLNRTLKDKIIHKMKRYILSLK